MLKICDTAEMQVRIWGGPRDGHVLNISESTTTLVVPEAASSFREWAEMDDPTVPMPKVETVSYRIMHSPIGVLAVHPNIDTGPLTGSVA